MRSLKKFIHHPVQLFQSCHDKLLFTDLIQIGIQKTVPCSQFIDNISSKTPLEDTIIWIFCSSIAINVFEASPTDFNPLSANPTEWSSTLKQFKSMFDHFVKLALKGLNSLNIVSLQFQGFYLKAKLKTMKYVDYTYQCTHVLGNHKVSVYHIHQYATSNFVFWRSTSDVKVLAFTKFYLIWINCFHNYSNIFLLPL